jgi:hypothetical protein
MKEIDMAMTKCVAAALAALALLAQGCSKSDDVKITIGSPKQAASNLEQAFANSSDEVKEKAGIASDALRKGDYERAVVSLQAVSSTPGITLEQGLAIHSSVMTMEDTLIRAMESGDENAKRAYQLLKQMKRN